jgi:hypothetical protein
MKSKLIFFSLLLYWAMPSIAQLTLDSTFVYDEAGVKHWYHIQKDVYCFKIAGDVEYSGTLNPCVANVTYWDNAPSKFNEVNFNPASPLMQRANQVTQIQNMSDYTVSSYSLTKDATSDFTQQEYYRTDDLLLITFNDPSLSAVAVNAFASLYQLTVVHAPDPALPNSVSWSYIFKLIPIKGEERNTIAMAQLINESEPTLVKLAEPNMYATYPLGCNPTSEIGLSPGGTDGTWHIRNTGGVIWSGYSGTNDADADICECWGEGYTGNGIKVGIIDFGGIKFSHDDYSGTNINQMYNAQDGFYYTTDTYLDPANGHGQQVTGVVAATPNNSTLGFRYAVGSAYSAEVIPYIVADFSGGLPASNSQISTSIQRAVLDGVDVVNMSFKTNAGVGTIGIQINNATSTGRPDLAAPGGAWGIVFVAGAGNDDVNGTSFPANMVNVIGVGWSNPEDYRSSYNAPGTGGSWTAAPGEGSTYGDPSNNFDVVAPGELIMTTDYGSGNYIFAKGSSFSAPIVSSVTAIILDKNPNLTYIEVRDLIRDGAEKVHPGLYNYNMYGAAPGYNDEMFYGRVSCINSISLTPLTIGEQEELAQLTVMKQNENQYLIFLPQNQENLSYKLYDMSGRLLFIQEIEDGFAEVLVDLTNFSSGMFIFELTNNDRPLATTKLIK